MLRVCMEVADTGEGNICENDVVDQSPAVQGTVAPSPNLQVLANASSWKRAHRTTDNASTISLEKSGRLRRRNPPNVNSNARSCFQWLILCAHNQKPQDGRGFAQG